jgi:hypothetical protein
VFEVYRRWREKPTTSGRELLTGLSCLLLVPLCLVLAVVNERWQDRLGALASGAVALAVSLGLLSLSKK